MKFFFLLILLILSPVIGCAATIPVSPEIQIEPVTSFTTLELWNATTPISVEFGIVTVNHRMIDSEAPIVRGKWINCGLVMVGTGDIGTRPVAFRVWTKQACDLSIRKPKESGSPGKAALDFFVNSTVSLPIRVSSELVVTVSGKRVGRIQTAGKNDR